MGACLYVQKISNFTASDATTSEQTVEEHATATIRARYGNFSAYNEKRILLIKPGTTVQSSITPAKPFSMSSAAERNRTNVKLLIRPRVQNATYTFHD